MSQIAARARRAYSSKIKPLRAVRSSPQKFEFPIDETPRCFIDSTGRGALITLFFDVKFSSRTTAIQTTTKKCSQGHSYSENRFRRGEIKEAPKQPFRAQLADIARSGK